MARHYLNYNKILLHHDYNSIIVEFFKPTRVWTSYNEFAIMKYMVITHIIYIALFCSVLDYFIHKC
jgi:preprotein translocase subunit SecE